MVLTGPLSWCCCVQEAVRKAQEELAMQKGIIMTQDKDIKVTAGLLISR